MSIFGKKKEEYDDEFYNEELLEDSDSQEPFLDTDRHVFGVADFLGDAVGASVESLEKEFKRERALLKWEESLVDKNKLSNAEAQDLIKICIKHEDDNLLNYDNPLDWLNEKFNFTHSFDGRTFLYKNLELNIPNNPKKSFSMFFNILHSFNVIQDYVAEQAMSLISSLNHSGPLAKLMAQIPFGICKDVVFDFDNMKAVLDEHLLGLENPKKLIMENFALGMFSKNAIPQPILLVGPPGVGKTEFGYSISKAIDLPFTKISFAGLFDMPTLKGASSSWSSGHPGLLIRSLVSSQCLNPVLLFDEIDKCGGTSAGDITSILTEVLDPVQNSTYTDAYISIPVDMSKTLFISTANEISYIPSHIQDRCVIIEVPEYSTKEKTTILQEFTSKRIAKELLLDFSVTEKVCNEILKHTSSLRQAKAIMKSHIAQEVLSNNKILESRKFILESFNEKLVPHQSSKKGRLGF